MRHMLTGRRFALPAVAIVLLLAFGAVADDAPRQPRSPAAVSAAQKFAAAEKKAQDEMNRVVSVALKQEVEELKKARADVMKSGSNDALAEANAIDAAIKDAEERLSTERKTPAFAKELTGTVWEFLAQGSKITYGAGGKLTCNKWKVATTWEVIGDHKVRQTEPNGGVVIVTFTDDLVASLWVYPGGGINHATRQR